MLAAPESREIERGARRLRARRSTIPAVKAKPVGLVVAVVCATLASASLAEQFPRFHTRDTMWYRVDMDSATVVPRAAAPKTARGFFAAKLVIVKSRPLATLAWRLELSGLSSPSTSRAVEAHIHTGRPGTVGPEVIQLCGPREPRAKGSTTLPAALARQISGSSFWPAGPERADVDVRTRKNPRGEIRGSLGESPWRGDIG